MLVASVLINAKMMIIINIKYQKLRKYVFILAVEYGEKLMVIMYVKKEIVSKMKQ